MKGTAALRRQILARSARIAVLGQGYVGLSLACAAADAGFQVTGIDVDERRVTVCARGDRRRRRRRDRPEPLSPRGRLVFTTRRDGGCGCPSRFPLRPDAAARGHTRSLVHRRERPRDCASHLQAGHAGGPGVHDLPGDHRRAGSAHARTLRAGGRARTSCWPTRPSESTPATPSISFRQVPSHGRRQHAGGDRARRPCSTSSSSTRSCRSRPAERPSSRSCSRTPSAT